MNKDHFLLWPVGAREYNDRQDVLEVKERLSDAGLLKKPKGGFSVHVDQTTDRAIREFQSEIGLDRDGRITRDGPTWKALASVAADGAVNDNKKSAPAKSTTPDAAEPGEKTPKPKTPEQLAEENWRTANRIWREHGPLDKDGTPLPPHAKDYRFDGFGRVRRDLFTGDPANDNAVIQGLEAFGFDGKTSEIVRHDKRTDMAFIRDRETGRMRVKVVGPKDVDPPVPPLIPEDNSNSTIPGRKRCRRFPRKPGDNRRKRKEEEITDAVDDTLTLAELLALIRRALGSEDNNKNERDR